MGALAKAGDMRRWCWVLLTLLLLFTTLLKLWLPSMYASRNLSLGRTFSFYI